MAYVASLHGSGGAVSLPATAYDDLVEATHIYFFEWHATFSRELIVDSSFSGADNWETYVGGMYDLKGTALGTLPTVAANIMPLLGGVGGIGTENATPAAENFILTMASGRTYTFEGMISSIRIVTPKPTRVICTVSFESHGDVSVA